MTTLDMVPTVDELLEDFRRSALRRRLRPSLPAVPMIHLGVVSLFSLLCLGLVH